MGINRRNYELTDKGRYTRKMQFQARGKGPLQLTPVRAPLKTVGALSRLGLTGRRELQAR